MASESSVSSNAFNFLKHMQNGVDPRTGLYMFRIELSGLYGSDLLAPEIDLSLRYSPLNLHDRGFGRGWSLPTSEFDFNRGRRIISLANGETFKADGRVGTTNQLTMSEKKIDTFHLYEDSDSQWRVVHRSGVVEVLEPKGTDKNARAVPTRIFSRQGHWLDLEYTTHAGFPMLSKITDMRDEVVFEVTPRGQGNRVTLAQPSDTGSASYTLVLNGDSRVERIELPTENLASWRFSYGEQRGLYCLREVRTPTGGFEEITYGDGGHQFPIGSGLTPLPRVTRHVQHPGHGQPPIDTRYTYGADGHNFLGGNIRLDWTDDGLDNLFRQVIEYDYATTETLWVDEKPVRSIVREFNKFHLNTREAVFRGSRLNAENTEVIGNNIEEKTISYDLRNGRFKEQVNACQLPIKIQTRWWVLDSSRHRVEEVVNQYDDYGNVLKQQHANGIVETHTWYRNGDQDYPGNAEGFVCDMHTRTVTPAAGRPGNAPTLVTTNRYRAYDALASSSEAIGRQAWCGLHSETLTHDERILKVTTYAYHEQADERPIPGQPLLHGRLKTRTVGFPNPGAGEPGEPQMLETAVGYEYRFDTLEWGGMRDARLHELPPITVISNVQTIVGYDQTRLQSSEGHSRFTGQLLLAIDQDKVERRNVFDRLQRLIFEVVAGASENEAVLATEYTLCADETEQAQQRVTLPTSVIAQTLYDGLGRVHQERVDNLNPAQPKVSFIVRELLHDAWGREVEDRQYDWLDAKPFPADVPFLAQKYLYDSWEARSVVIRTDNVQEHTQFDPTVTDADNNRCHTTWLQAGQQTQKSTKVITWNNAFDKPVHIQRLGSDDAVEATQQLLYDGLGQCVSNTDERNKTTRFEYDPFGRMSASVLPDDTRVEHRYAWHTDAEWATSIMAIANAGSEAPFEVGGKHHDGLGRVTSLRIGKRTETFIYDPDQTTPKSRVTGARDTIDFQYDLPLTRSPTHRSVNAVDAQYVYDPVTALMKESRSPNGDRFYHYDAHGRFTGETLVRQGEAERTVNLVSSFFNRLKLRTDAAQMTTEHDYDERGRMKATTQGNLHATFDYDSLGRLMEVTSTDTDSGSKLTTALQYDEHGRENKRTHRLDNSPARVVRQVWGKDNLLETRVSQNGHIIRLREKFTYDVRGRLSIVEYSGGELPADEAGRKVRKQVFRYDSIDNIRQCQTTFSDDTTQMATYAYTEADRFLLESLTLTSSGENDEIYRFCHDQNGNLTLDQRGRPLIYDEYSQLRQLGEHSRYLYDGEGQMLSSQAGDAPPRQLWFEENRLSLAIQNDVCTHFSFHTDMPLAQQGGSSTKTLLLQTDASHTVTAECEAGTVRDIQYTAYGQRHVTIPVHSQLGFNGEALDEASDWYMLGRGVRAYNPELRRFNSPDPRSVFETGELNPYSYCLNNPIVLRDPTGMTTSNGGGRPRRPDEDDPNWLGRGGGGGSAMSWIGLAVGILFTIAAVVTAGASLAAVGVFGAAAANAISAAGAAVTAGTAGAIDTFLGSFAGTTIGSTIYNVVNLAVITAGTVLQTMSLITKDPKYETAAFYVGLGAAGLNVAWAVGKAGVFGAKWVSKVFERAARAGRPIPMTDSPPPPSSATSATSGTPRPSVTGSVPRSGPPAPPSNLAAAHARNVYGALVLRFFGTSQRQGLRP
ncbi:RHS repeat domain-containing protein [Pseudomonas sp. FYR_11]|uniref:RHS repeat domain-containing protein n=1 Tax=Pseudomonas TaxID=286 RepID=UPI00370B7336